LKLNLSKRTVIITLLMIAIMTSTVFAKPLLKTIQLSDNDITIQLNGKEISFGEGEKPFVHNGTTYVPLRTFAEQDNKEVSWDGKNNQAIITDGSKISSSPLLEQNVSGTLWLMSSENRANSYQAFNLAKMMFDKAMDENKSKKKLAVIVDIDDTIIDSTSYTCQLMGGKEWTTQAWEEWIASDAPKAIPGSVGFLNYVVDNGGEVFYITNRWPFGLL
jgi:5'-nucleotidase (lipoprotein e(P4) family)